AVIVEDNNEARSFAKIISGLLPPSQGEVAFGDVGIATIPESPLRQNLGFVTAPPYLFNAALSYNLGYGLNHISPKIQSHQQVELDAAVKAGTSPDWFDETFDCVWTDLARLGAEEWLEVLGWIYEQMSVVNASEQMVNLALREVFNPANYGDAVFGDFPQKLLALRPVLQQRLQENEHSHYLEVFQSSTFLHHSSMEENLIFGYCLSNDEHSREILIEALTVKLIAHDIFEDSHSIATVVLQQLLDGYNNATLSQHIIQKFNLSDHTEFSRLQHLNNLPKIAFNRREKRNINNSKELIEVFLKIVPADWSGIEFSASYENSVVAIRQELIEHLKSVDEISYYTFNENIYHPGLSVMNNILFGRFDEGNTEAFQILQTHVTDLVREEKFEANLVQLVIINNQAGVGGTRIPQSTRHTLNLARTLMKKPSILIMHDALLPLSQAQQATILNNIKTSRPDMSLIWISSEPQHTGYFDQVYQLNKTLHPVNARQQSAHNYPEHPISLLVAYNAGGATDYQARIVTMMAAAMNAQNEAKYLGQPLVVVNHPGKGGQDGWNHFIDNSASDGYELAVYNIPHVIAQAIIAPDTVSYTLDQLEPLVNWGADPAVFIVSTNSPFHSMKDVLRFVKKRPGKLTLSGAGLYTGHHIAALQLNKATGIKARYVSGGGGDNALKMVARRQVIAGFNNLSDAYRYRGQIRVLGIADLTRNNEFFPDVPTLIEQGIDVDDASVNFRGIMAPKGLPEDQLAYLAKQMSAMFADELVVEKMSEAGAPLHIMNSEAIREMWLKRQSLVADLITDIKGKTMKPL
ncbi:MAG: Tricarboxylate transport protein TctC, partial [uncultured Thiotrichaceae bacterium]